LAEAPLEGAAEGAPLPEALPEPVAVAAELPPLELPDAEAVPLVVRVLVTLPVAVEVAVELAAVTVEVVESVESVALDVALGSTAAVEVVVAVSVVVAVAVAELEALEDRESVAEELEAWLRALPKRPRATRVKDWNFILNIGEDEKK